MKFKNRKIMIVDDNVSIHEDFRKILKPLNTSANKAKDDLESAIFGGESKKEDKNTPIVFEHDLITYELHFASQGEEALEKVAEAETTGNPFALIFMDVRMPPGIDGIETARRIWDRFPEVQISICSAYSDYSWSDMVAKLGATDNLMFLKKPFEKMEVQQLALAMTSKWNSSKELKYHMTNLEQIVREKTAELESTRAKNIESAKFTALGEMSAGLAHEINTPLATIMLTAGQIHDGIVEDDVSKEFIQGRAKAISDVTERIAKIIRGLRTFSKSSAQDPQVPAPIAQIIEDTLTFCRNRFGAHEVQIEIDDQSNGESIVCQPVQVSQVLLNLLNNAFDAIQDLPEKWIRLGARFDGDIAELTVTDSGKGIPPEVVSKIMDPFFTTKPLGKGMGLGLSISRGIIESHGGTMAVDSTSPNTKFVVRLPRKGASQKAG